MRQIDQVATALGSALGYSRRHNDARVKVLCHGSDRRPRSYRNRRVPDTRKKCPTGTDRQKGDYGEHIAWTDVRRKIETIEEITDLGDQWSGGE